MSRAVATRRSVVLPETRVGSRDGEIALAASWAVVGLLTFQGVASMVSMINPELGVGLRVIGAMSSVVTAALFMYAQHRTRTLRPLARTWLVAIMVVSTIGFVTGAWLTPGPAWAALALGVRGRSSMTVSGLTAVALAAFLLAENVHPLYIAGHLLANAVIALLLYSLSRLAMAVGELNRTRETLARMEVDQERLRISRDLHDIMGRSLIAVSLRVQTALRTVDKDPDKCRSQLAEIAKMVSDGQNSLRSLTQGATFMGLEQELDTAHALLDRLRVTCIIDVTCRIRPSIDELGARVVRESVTNILKHSRPTQVTIRLREDAGVNELEIVNDRAPEKSGTGGREGGGTGLADLAGHVRRSGGALEAGPAPGGRFRVAARIPYSEDARPVLTAPEEEHHG